MNDTNALSIYGQYDQTADFELMRQQDIILPRLNLMQPGNAHVIDGKANGGDYINSSTLLPVIKRNEAGLIVPVMMWIEWVEWNPNRKDKSKRIIARDVNPTGTLAKIAAKREMVINDEGKSIPRISETYTFLVLTEVGSGNYKDMMLFSCARSAYFPAKQWLNRMKLLKREIDKQMIPVPMPCAAWNLATEVKEKEGNKFIVPKFGDAVFLDPDVCKETMALATRSREQRAEFQNVSLQSNIDDADDAHEADTKDAFKSGPAL